MSKATPKTSHNAGSRQLHALVRRRLWKRSAPANRTFNEGIRIGMNQGQKIMEGIIEGNLLRTECAHDPEHGCVTVWSSGAAEQIEALACSNKPARRAGADSLHTLARRKLADALVAGYKLSNVAYNYAQNGKLEEGERALFKRCCKEWDDAMAALPKHLRVST